MSTASPKDEADDSAKVLCKILGRVCMWKERMAAEEAI